MPGLDRAPVPCFWQGTAPANLCGAAASRAGNQRGVAGQKSERGQQGQQSERRRTVKPTCGTVEHQHRHVTVGHHGQLHRPPQQPILAAPEHHLFIA